MVENQQGSLRDLVVVMDLHLLVTRWIALGVPKTAK